MESAPIHSARRNLTLPGLLLAATLITGTIVWFIYAPRFFFLTAASYGEHWSHAPLLLLHVGGGTTALMLGVIGLWTGLTRRKLPWHRWMGRIYLLGGGTGVLAGMILSLLAPHEPRSLYVSTFVLALFWFGAALMAWRAIIRRRIELHQEWMIRSYLLTFTFILCRIAMQFPLFGFLGLEGITATVWFSWTIPVFITEVLLQWRKTA